MNEAEVNFHLESMLADDEMDPEDPAGIAPRWTRRKRETGAAIRARREELKKTREEIERVTGISVHEQERYESGAWAPPPEDLELLARELRCNVSDFTTSSSRRI